MALNWIDRLTLWGKEKEEEMQGDSWGKERIIRIALIDLVFASSLLAYHAFHLVIHGSENDLPTKGMSPDTIQALSIFLWVSIFALNILQIILSFNLFSALKEEVPDPLVYLNVSNQWSQFSVFVVALLLIKLVLVVFCKFFEGRFLISVILIAAEVIFKLLGIFLIRTFIKRLRSVFVPSSLPSNHPIQFIAVPLVPQSHLPNHV